MTCLAEPPTVERDSVPPVERPFYCTEGARIRAVELGVEQVEERAAAAFRAGRRQVLPGLPPRAPESGGYLDLGAGVVATVISSTSRANPGRRTWVVVHVERRPLAPPRPPARWRPLPTGRR